MLLIKIEFDLRILMCEFPEMRGVHKKNFQRVCLGRLMGEGGRLLYNLEAVASETGIPVKSLRQFKTSGILGDAYCDRLASYLFGAERWVDVVATERKQIAAPPPAPTISYQEPVKMNVVDMLTKLIGDVAVLKKQIEDIKDDLGHLKTDGGSNQKKSI